MDPTRLQELHFITPIENLPSVLRQGILCHNLAPADAKSIADQDIQDRRVGRRVPGGQLLHDYANLYVHARNPMMFKRHPQHASLCVVRIDTAVLEVDGTVIADGNAASDYTRFAAAPDGLRIIDEERTFLRNWTHSHAPEYWERKRRKCAEVLVPRCVPPTYIRGVYVSGSAGRSACTAHCSDGQITVNADLFFKGG